MRYITILLLSVALFGCGNNASPDIPQEVAINLPPDPGTANNLTIEGIDQDNDGVRDDVQRWIVSSSYDNPASLSARLQVARTIQAAVVVGQTNDLQRALSYAENSVDAGWCLLSVEDDRTAFDLQRQILKQTLNTDDRVESYNSFSTLINARTFGGIDISIPFSDYCTK